MLTKSKIFAFSVVALLALNGCGDRGAGSDGSGAGGAGGGGDGSHYPKGQDTDKDGLTDNHEDKNGNGKVDPGETDRLNPDTDGDGLKDGNAKETAKSLDGKSVAGLRSCEPAQPAGYDKYDYTNKMWVIPDCDGDGYKNGTEDNESLGTNHKISDPYSASSACFTFRSKTYCEAHTKDGKTWLDRNLGADKNCATSDDALCYGDLYQWGRTTDGHELRGSTPDDVNPVEADYLWRSPLFEVAAAGEEDWLTKIGDEDHAGDQKMRADYWQDPTTGEVCPDGWYIPSLSEANTTMNAENITDAPTALASPLKIGLSGERSTGGAVQLVGTLGGYYTTDFGADNTVRSMTVKKTEVIVSKPAAAKGFAIRCLKQ